MLARGVVALVAVLVIAWLGVQVRDRDIVDEMSPALVGDRDLPRTRFERDLDRLADARLLNPDPSWRVIAAIALVPRDPARAAAEAERLVRDEPDNAAGWRVLLAAVRGRDRHRSQQAWRELRRLDPLATR